MICAPTYNGEYSYTGIWSSTTTSLDIDVAYTSGTATDIDYTRVNGFEMTAVSSPEPSTLVLLGTALLGLLAYAWRKRKGLMI